MLIQKKHLMSLYFKMSFKRMLTVNTHFEVQTESSLHYFIARIF